MAQVHGRRVALCQGGRRARRPSTRTVSAATLSASAVLVAVAGLLGLGVGVVLARLAGSFPWGKADTAPGTAVPSLVLAPVTGVLFALTAWRFGLAWDLPAFLVLAAAGVL